MTRRPLRDGWPILIGLILIFFQGIAFGADRDRPAPSEKTIVLDESQIKGADAHADGDPPPLSTSLSWEGAEEEEDPNLAREIFRKLSQPDPSYFTEEWSEEKQDETTKGD